MAQAKIAEMIESAHTSLREADDLSNVNSADRETLERLNDACQTLLEIVRLQETRNQHVATALDTFADAIGYPINSAREMREQVRAVAAIVRGES